MTPLMQEEEWILTDDLKIGHLTTNGLGAHFGLYHETETQMACRGCRRLFPMEVYDRFTKTIELMRPKNENISWMGL